MSPGSGLSGGDGTADTRGSVALSTRVTLTVATSFLAVFALLLVVGATRALMHGSGEIDHAMMEVARGVVVGVSRVNDEMAARTVIATHGALNETLRQGAAVSVPHLYVARDGHGHHATLGSPEIDLAAIREGVGSLDVDGVRFRSYSSREEGWKVVVLDAQAARRQSVLVESMADLAFYMALALPVVLVPVWLSVRTGLSPLRRLSGLVQRRHPDDMSPLPVSRSYRELVPLERALNEQFRRAAERIRREKAFVHDAAHELRTPLAVISTQAHLLAGSAGDAQKEARTRLQAAVERASHLVQQLLRLARADVAGPISAESIDLMDIARDVLAMIADQAAAQGTELSLDGPEHARTRGDAQLMRSLIFNLVDNALRYGGPGGDVAVALALKSGQWILSVSDCGPGLPPQDRERAFERFWRGASNLSPGTGLGLAIVRQVAQTLGGSASIQSREGGGCIAIVQWPVSEALRP